MSTSNKNERVKQLSVCKSDSNDIDADFQAIRTRFDAEMQQMEAEMAKFRGKLNDKQRDCDLRSLSPSARQKDISSFVDSLNSPLITSDPVTNGRVLKLKFDVTDFAPEEIIVKTVDNKLQVHAKHEEKSDSRSVFREYNREFVLPDGTNPENIRSSLSRDGVLSVELPLNKDNKEAICSKK